MLRPVVVPETFSILFSFDRHSDVLGVDPQWNAHNTADIQQIYFPFVLGALFFLFIYDVFKCIPGRRWLIILLREYA
jgi:hypothetical protein